MVWSRDNIALGSSAAPASVSEFTHFFEIFFREPTTTGDLGVYSVAYSGEGGIGTKIIVMPPGIICVIQIHKKMKGDCLSMGRKLFSWILT